MIEQQREMLKPGKGILRDDGPMTQHKEYPKMMTHPGYQKGVPDQEIKVLDENGMPTGRLVYKGGQPNRFSPVLVHSRADEEYHAAQGYGNPVQCDAAAFDRLVASSPMTSETYVPIEYPKYVFGKIVNDAEEAEARLAELNINADGSPRGSETTTGKPALSAEVNTLEVWPPLADEVRARLPVDIRHQMTVDDLATQALREREEDDDIVDIEDNVAPFTPEQAEIAALEEALAGLKNKRRIAALKAEIAAEIAEMEAPKPAGPAKPEPPKRKSPAHNNDPAHLRKMTEARMRKHAERKAEKLAAERAATNQADTPLE